MRAGEEPDRGWYSARLLYREEIEHSPTGLFEEKIIVFSAVEDSDLITAKLDTLAKAQEEEFQNKFAETVRWIFQEVLEIQDISAKEVGDGTEVFFRWWQHPTDEDFKLLRETHREPWWKSEQHH
jgi:hypothetical protein